MAAKETTLNELGELLAHVVERMVTKDDLATVRSELKSDIAALRTELKGDLNSLATKADLTALAEQVAGIERDLTSIRRGLNDLINKVDNIVGYRKEIDHAFERIGAIERHLGIRRQAA